MSKESEIFMPLITTHNFFARDVFLSTPKKITKTFESKKNFYELFAQGFDPFVFYEFFKLKKQNLQNYCHTNDTDTFFLNFIATIKEQNFLTNPTILACLYGHLTHYVLDSTMHPYIVYKTGEYQKNNPDTLKYNGLHNKFEMEIDAYFYEQNYHKPYKNFAIHKHLITKEKFDKDLLNILNTIYKTTYKINEGGKKYQKGCKKMYFSYKFLITDRTGLKKKIYKIVDCFTKKKKGVYENYSNHIAAIDYAIFNTEHKVWLNPWNKKESTESFFDLYKKAKERCQQLFIETNKYLNDEITKEAYQKVLKDYSYVTGFSWHDKKEIQYLEF